MAKKLVQASKPHAVVVADKSVQDFMMQTSEDGRSTAAADNLTPLLKLLQRGSPEVLKKNPSYVDGAEAGDIYIRSSSDPLIKGQPGFDFQPCQTQHVWVEWVPREKGGGFAGIIEAKKDLRGNLIPPPGAKQLETNKFVFVMPNGNELKDTRYVNGILYSNISIAKNQDDVDPDNSATWILDYDYKLATPVSIPLTSTGHSTYRTLMTVANSIWLPNSSAKASFYAKPWRFSTREQTNPKGTWFKFDVTITPGFEEHFLTLEDQKKGKALFDAFESGEKKVEAPEPDDDEVAVEASGRM